MGFCIYNDRPRFLMRKDKLYYKKGLKALRKLKAGVGCCCCDCEKRVSFIKAGDVGRAEILDMFPISDFKGLAKERLYKKRLLSNLLAHYNNNKMEKGRSSFVVEKSNGEQQQQVVPVKRQPCGHFVEKNGSVTPLYDINA